MFPRRAVPLCVLSIVLAACGSSAPRSSSAPSVDTAAFHDALVAAISAKSFDYSVTTRSGSGPAVAGTGAYVAPDRSRLESGGVERVAVGDAAYFRGGAFGADGWAKADKGAAGDPEALATLIVAQDANPVVREGSAYVFEVPATATSPERKWKVWITNGRVGRVLYTSGNALSWDQRFTNYDGSQTIEAPAAADTHELTETPPCAAGQQANFRGFCQGPPA